MFQRSSLLSGWLLFSLSSSAIAVDLEKIDRTIAKEPAYQSKAPRYGLLVFGPEAEQRVWIVHDGNTVYVDANGNGDLTEAGEKAGLKDPQRTSGGSFEEVTILDDGETSEKLSFYNQEYGNFVDTRVTVSWKGRWHGAWGDGDGRLVFSTRPGEAPILHVGGPLEMGFEVRKESAFSKQGDGVYELKVGVGTRGLGKGSFVHLTYLNDAIPKDVYPTAELNFPGKSANDPPLLVHTTLKQRC